MLKKGVETSNFIIIMIKAYFIWVYSTWFVGLYNELQKITKKIESFGEGLFRTRSQTALRRVSDTTLLPGSSTSFVLIIHVSGYLPIAYTSWEHHE